MVPKPVLGRSYNSTEAYTKGKYLAKYQLISRYI